MSTRPVITASWQEAVARCEALQIALAQCQSMRDELREERDAAITANAELFAPLAGLVDHFTGRFLPFAMARELRPLLEEAAAIVAKHRISL